MATTPRTYRVSDDVDAELRRLGEIHGGVNRALLLVLDMNILPENRRTITPEIEAKIKKNVTPRMQLDAVANPAGSNQGKASMETEQPKPKFIPPANPFRRPRRTG